MTRPRPVRFGSFQTRPGPTREIPTPPLIPTQLDPQGFENLLVRRVGPIMARGKPLALRENTRKITYKNIHHT